MEKSIEKIPTYALPYLVNGDATNLNYEDIKMIDNICKTMHLEIVSPHADCEPYFTHYPFFGEATDVVDCTIIFNNPK